MSFDQQGFGPIGGENMLASAVWSYRTSDTLADIQVASYFDDKVFQIEDGDFLVVTSSDASAIGFFSNDGSTVSVTIIEGSEGVENPWPPFVSVDDTDSPVTVSGNVACYTADTTNGDVIFILPATLKGNFVFKKNDSSLNQLIIDGNGNNVDGSATRNLTSQYASYTINHNGSEWTRQ